MQITERHFTRNAPLYDGTPRHEKGYRPRVWSLGPDACKHFGYMGTQQKRLWVGPLCKTQAEAEAWTPSDEAWKTALTT